MGQSANHPTPTGSYGGLYGEINPVRDQSYDMNSNIGLTWTRVERKIINWGG